VFFLRCIFWLSIVYASMSWTNGALTNRDLVQGSAKAGRVAAEAVDMASSGLSVLCKRHPADCLADAARLTALVDASASPAPRAAEAPASTIAAVPMPVPDPRRQEVRQPGRPKGLTPTP
jgi:hypothetical protein